MYASRAVVGAALGFGAGVSAQIDNNRAPYPIAFASNNSIGPDGPWWYIPTSVDYPDEYMYLLPSLSNTSLIVNSTVCSSQTAKCPLTNTGVPPQWHETAADIVSNDNQTVGPDHDSAYWDARYSEILNMTAQGQFLSNRLTLYENGQYKYDGSGQWLSTHAFQMSNGYTVNYPGGASYTIDSGFFSLYGKTDAVSWPDVNGFVWHNNRTLPGAYLQGIIPSNSYGLHVGSVSPNITGSLVLGGYDSSRCLDTPLSTSEQYVQLTSISLNVSSGDSAYQNASSVPINNLLRANGRTISSINVTPDPGVPYMYLPRQTCDSISRHLPVTYNADFNLYIWNTDSNGSYHDIVSSPHYLAFSLAGDSGSSTTIKVPFALLNLTLDTPLSSTPMQYFPCSPKSHPGTTGYTLGRSFLQAAFLAQNWNSSSMFLAQAPGPNFLPAAIKNIAYTDTSLNPASNPPSWEATWSSLAPLKSASAGPSSAVSGESGLSGGDIAGVVVGVIAGVVLLAALAAFLLIRKRRGNSRNRDNSHESEELRPYHDSPGKQSSVPAYVDAGYVSYEKRSRDEPQQLPNNEVVEVSAGQVDPVEMDGIGVRHELDTPAHHDT
ncbi:putative peptidase A1 family protein [Teratosphaeria destructans]|uniref:Peptidase A1 family protein n=1 Tax=Teratosphaeria destructans TaxID=418781 RepID=A0A9W7W374_9PEZI|nr:putative peptidase A1 family protein [Teratosphaeria destructans]